MQFLPKTLAVATLATLVATTAQADTSFYSGIKLGKLNIDRDGIENPMTHGIYGGYAVDNGIGVEAQYLKTEKFGTDGSYVPTLGLSMKELYATYHKPLLYLDDLDVVYLKGKLGGSILKSDVKKERGIAFGVGVGANFTDDLAVEAEYVKQPDFSDTNMSQINFAGRYRF